MADLFTPKTWSDGEQYNAVNVNRLENGLEAIDLDLDDLRDQVAALLAGGGSSRQILSGPTASRPSPAIGLEYWDTSLGTVGKLIIGTGTSWAYPDGTLVSGDGGGGTAPTGMTATVTAGGTIGSINLSWNAVPSATSYKLYETESPTGVSGATALTTTSTSRTPSVARNYEYWVTALVAGVESATSNRVTATLPFSGGGGGGSSDPTTFLNINGKGTATGGWWNLGIGFESGHVDITPTQLQGGYINNPYYVMNSAGSAVQFQVFMNGGRTSTNTKYPRSELREMATGSTSTKASWSGSSGHHILRGKSKVMHYAPVKCEAVVAQMHDASDDTLQIRAEASSATGSQTWRLSINGSEVDDLISGVALGQEVAWDIDVNNGNLTVKINGTTQYTGNPGWGSGQYFKVGEYVQQNSTDQDNPSSEYGRVELRDLFCSHS
jgi:hypothetical protein